MRFMQPSRPWLPLFSVLGVLEVNIPVVMVAFATVTKPLIPEHLGNFHLEVLTNSAIGGMYYIKAAFMQLVPQYYLLTSDVM